MEVGAYFSWYGLIGVLKILGLTSTCWEEREDLQVEVVFSSEKQIESNH